MLYEGLISLPWWGCALVVLGLTHVTIVTVTVFLHRCQAHRSLELRPAASHFFRFWQWLTTGMITKEWAAVHRKHHAKVESADDPHSPQVMGIHRVLWGGVFCMSAKRKIARPLKNTATAHPTIGWSENSTASIPKSALP